jgi:antitoxin component of RelBE/YafQ-DinJ toxin-antitoxin module
MARLIGNFLHHEWANGKGARNKAPKKACLRAQLRHNCGMTEILRVRVNPALLRQANEVAREIGTSSGEVIRLMLKQMVKRRAIPFPLQADTLESEALSPVRRRAELWDSMNEGQPSAR